MLGFKQSSSVYRLLGALLIGAISASAYAERTLEETVKRSGSKHNSQNRQSSDRIPASVISENNPQHEERSFHPISPRSTEPQPIPPSQRDTQPNNSFPNPVKRTPAVLESTLSGRVERWSGNHMPTRGAITEASKTQPLQTKVYIFKGKVKSNGPTLEFSSDTQKVFAVVNSDKNGSFKVQLPPGEYTVFAEIEGKLYKNSFDGLGNFSTVTMLDGKSSMENIIDSREANF
ncbi:MAG: hypothetical protein ACKOA8_11060 [Deltaproteobacteria bacterium]